MKATLPESNIDHAQIATVQIGELSVGPLDIDSLVLTGTELRLSTGEAKLRNVTVSVTLTMELDWSVSVSIFLVGSFGWNGTISLGQPSLTVGFGDVSLPGLENLTVDLASLAVEEVSASLNPVQNLQFGDLLVNHLKATGVVAPVPDLQLLGIGLGRASAERLSLPGATVAAVEIGSVQGGRLPMDDISLASLSFPDELIADTTGAGLDTEGTANPIGFHADVGVLEVTLRVTPSVRIQAEQFSLSGVRAGASFDSVVLSGVSLPFEFSNLTLSELGITDVSLPLLEVS